MIIQSSKKKDSVGYLLEPVRTMSNAICKVNFGGHKISNNVAKARRMAKAFMTVGWNPEQQVT